MPATATTVDDWQRYRCTKGEFFLHAISTQPGIEPDVVDVRVPGQVDCGVEVPGPELAVAVYRPGAATGDFHLKLGTLPYRSPDGPTPFVTQGGVRLDEPLAICVVSDFDLRLACLAVISPKTGAVRVEPLSPSDPLVDRPVTIIGTEIGPNCGTCWRALTP